MTTEARYVRSEAVLSREVDSALLLMAPGRGDVIALGGSGQIIWSLLRDPHTVEELVESLAARFDLKPSEIEADVRDALDSLQVADVIRSDAA